MKTKTSLLVLGLFSVLLLAMSVVATGQASVSCSGVIAWAAGGNYTVGELVTYEGSEYKCLQANNDAAPNWDPIDWPAGWTLVGTCSGGGGATATATKTATKTATSVGTATKTATKTATATATKTATPCQTNCSASGFIFSPYKDVTVDANWNTGEQQTSVTGTEEAVTAAMTNSTLTWAFATGTCGSETWAGITPALEASNVSMFTSAGKDYIISTGGADGSFDCPSSSAFASFIQKYYSSNMKGVDFDIEVGQGQAVVDDLINAVKGVEGTYSNMRFSFTVAALGTTSANPIFNSTGVLVANQIKSLGLGGNYTINPMAFDFGSASSSNCVVSGGKCEMGQSAIAAVEAVNQQYGTPYGHLEVTVMVPADDEGETLTMSDVSTLCSWLKSNGAAGIHFWSFDRDTSLTYTNAIKSACGTN